MELTKQAIYTFLFFWLCQVSLEAADVEVILDRIEQVGSTDFIDATDLKVRRSGRDRKLFGKFEYKVDMDNSITARISAGMKTGAGWNILPYKVEKPYCEFIEEDKYFYPELANHSNATFPPTCPVPKVSRVSQIDIHVRLICWCYSILSSLTDGTHH